MFCTNCGKQLEYGSPFCRYCGAPAMAAGPVYPITKRKTNTAVIAIVIIAFVLLAVLTVWLLRIHTGGNDAFAASEDIIVDIEADDASVGAGGYSTGAPEDVTMETPAGEDQAGSNPVDVSGEPGFEQQNGMDYSTSERPGMEDFLWYTEGVYYDGVPYDSVAINNFSDVTGSWKAYILYDPDNIADAYGFEYLNMVLDGDTDHVSITFDWYKMYVGYSYEEYDFSNEDDSVLYGNYADYCITAGEPGYKVYLYAFYSANGKQYGLGYMELQSGEPTFIAMVRP
jgi:hypothetical protein